MKTLLLSLILMTLIGAVSASSEINSFAKGKNLYCQVENELFYVDECGEESAIFLEEDSINVFNGKVWYWDNDSDTSLSATDEETLFAGVYGESEIQAKFYLNDNSWQADVTLYGQTVTFFCYQNKEKLSSINARS